MSRKTTASSMAAGINKMLQENPVKTRVTFHKSSQVHDTPKTSRNRKDRRATKQNLKRGEF